MKNRKYEKLICVALASFALVTGCSGEKNSAVSTDQAAQTENSDTSAETEAVSTEAAAETEAGTENTEALTETEAGTENTEAAEETEAGTESTEALAETESEEESNQASAGTAAELGSLKTFTAATLDGGSFTQEDIAARDMTIINFWALTCGPCISEMPDLAAFAAALPDQVQMVTVCLDGAGLEEIVQGMLDKAGYQGVTLVSGDGDFIDVCRHIQYTPTTVIVDSEGNLVGDAIIGTQKDLSGTFLTALNEALKNDGKAEISLEK